MNHCQCLHIVTRVVVFRASVKLTGRIVGDERQGKYIHRARFGPSFGKPRQPRYIRIRYNNNYCTRLQWALRQTKDNIVRKKLDVCVHDDGLSDIPRFSIYFSLLSYGFYFIIISVVNEYSYIQLFLVVRWRKAKCVFQN